MQIRATSSYRKRNGHLKNRRPSEWRDVQHLDQAVGHYIISDRPMTEEQWIEERTKAAPRQIEAQASDVSPAVTQDADDAAKPLE